MNDLMMTVVGNVIRDVDLRFTGNGDPVASFRVDSNTRRFDRESERWIEGDTHYLSVTCWRTLATNVANSIKKGSRSWCTGGCVVVRWSVPAEMARTRCAIRTSRHTRSAQISLAARRTSRVSRAPRSRRRRPE